MNETNLSKSYMIIGPSGVGKSLISQTLSKKTGYPVFSIDDIIEFTKDNYNASSFPFLINEKKLLKYYKKLSKEYGPTYDKNSELDKKQDEMLKELSNLFFYYKNSLGGFKELKQKYLENKKLDSELQDAFSNLISLYIFQSLSVNVYKVIASKIDEPVIFDMPCNFAWFLPHDKVFEDYEIDYKQLNKEMTEILNSVGAVVLVEPGQDFEERNPEKKSSYFEFLLNNKHNYKQSDLIVSSNSLFYDPTEPLLANRSIFDAKAQQKREELLNKSELNNICDQIIELCSELAQQKQ